MNFGEIAEMRLARASGRGYTRRPDAAPQSRPPPPPPRGRWTSGWRPSSGRTTSAPPRAKLKKDLKAGKASIHALLLDPPEYVLTAKVFDMLLAVPKYGRVKTNRILNQCRISPSKTIGGLSERQRTELVAQLRGSAAQSRPPRGGQYPRPHGEGLRHHRPVRGRQGNADRASCCERVPDLELSVSATTREPREGEVDGRDYHFLTPEEFERRDRGRRLPRVRHLQRQPLRDPALRGRAAARRRAARSCSRSRSRAPSRCGRRCRESVQIFIAPPDPAVAARAARAAAAPTRAEAIDARLEVAEQELAAQGDFDHRSSTTISSRAAAELEGIVRAELGLSLDSARRMIKPRVDKLLEHADSHYAAVVVAAKRARQINSYFHNLGEGSFGEYPPPMVETRASGTTSRWRSKSLPRASSNTSTAPSAGARGASQEEPMARILLGVSGGIAAYKALELARLATLAGHGVRVLMTETRDPLRRRRLLRGHRRRAGAHLRVRARPDARRLPRRPAPEHDPIGHLELAANCDAYLVAPGLGQHDRQAGGRDRRLDAHHLLPRLRRAAPGRAGDERPHVRRRRDPGQPGDAARARGRR